MRKATTTMIDEIKIANTLLVEMQDIQYGWVDFANKIHLDDFDSFSEDYRLQSPASLRKSKAGVCWDQVELERDYFKGHNVSVKTYFLVYYDGKDCPTHTFLVFKSGGRFYWFEHSWECFRGLHQYQNIDELLSDVLHKFIKSEIKDEKYNSANLNLHEYTQPSYGLSVQEFYAFCNNGKHVDVASYMV